MTLSHQTVVCFGHCDYFMKCRAIVILLLLGLLLHSWPKLITLRTCLNFVPSCAKFVSIFASFVSFPVFPSFYSCHLYSFVTCHFVLYLATVIIIHFNSSKYGLEPCSIHYNTLFS